MNRRDSKLGRLAAVSAAALAAVGCYTSQNLTGDGSGDGGTGTCPARVRPGESCTAGSEPCTTEPYCQICGAGSYVVRSSTCFCTASSGGSSWECDHVDCGPMAPGTYSDPECTELRPYPDAGADADADVVDDGGTACESAWHWELEPWAIESVELWHEPSRLGTTDRLRVLVRAPSSNCYRLGRLQVVVSPGDATDFVTLSAFVWRKVGPVVCHDEELAVYRNVELEGRQHGNLRVVVVDGHSPGGGLRLEYGREPCSGVPDCACYPGTPAGTGTEWSDCRTDCSCAAGLSCLGFWGLAGPLWNCSRGCNDVLDCEPLEQCLPPVPDGSPWVCTFGDQCNDDWLPPCPFGFECVSDATDAPNRCVDRRSAPSVRPCTCDLDCATGELCLIGLRDTPHCEIPCRQSEDCPEDWLVCGTASICVPLGP